jgi:hypothetical protein
MSLPFAIKTANGGSLDVKRARFRLKRGTLRRLDLALGAAFEDMSMKTLEPRCESLHRPPRTAWASYPKRSRGN